MDLQSRVLKAAEALFQRSGLRFTMQEVAAALHISKKTIYTVYPSKEELLLGMVDALFADIHREKGDLMASSASIEERIQAVIVALPEQYRALDFRLLGTLDEKYPAVARRRRVAIVIKEHQISAIQLIILKTAAKGGLFLKTARAGGKSVFQKYIINKSRVVKALQRSAVLRERHPLLTFKYIACGPYDEITYRIFAVGA